MPLTQSGGLVLPYDAYTLTQESRLNPHVYGLVSALDIFPVKPIDSTRVFINESKGKIKVLSAKERGAPGDQADHKSELGRVFAVPHFAQTDQILPGDLQDRRTMIGGIEVPANLMAETADRLNTMNSNHAVTAEYVRMSALKGLIKDGAGQTLLNVFDAFDITQRVIPFTFSSSTFDVRAANEQIAAHIRQNLLGTAFSTVEVLVSTSFFSNLIEHPKVKDLYTHDNSTALRNLDRYQHGVATGRVFSPYGNVTYVEYDGYAPTDAGQEAYIEEGYGYAYPTGTFGVFNTFAAPANALSHVNQAPTLENIDIEEAKARFALPIYTSAKLLDHDKGIDFHSEMNLLPLCQQPAALVKLVSN